jgi:hypothetical protein
MSAGEIHEGPLAPVAAAPAPKQSLTWREQRWRRRRRRKIGEEILAWILVPLIVLGCWWLVNTVLSAMGTSPAAVIDQAKQAVQMLDKSRTR